MTCEAGRRQGGYLLPCTELMKETSAGQPVGRSSSRASFAKLSVREGIAGASIAGDLKFLVLDELHTYRGRQGADVSMLVRRLRETLKVDDVICVGTSAT